MATYTQNYPPAAYPVDAYGRPLVAYHPYPPDNNPTTPPQSQQYYPVPAPWYWPTDTSGFMAMPSISQGSALDWCTRIPHLAQSSNNRTRPWEHLGTPHMRWEPPIPASTGLFVMGQGAAYVMEVNIATHVSAYPRPLWWDGLPVPPVQLPPSPRGQGNAPRGTGDACSRRQERIADYMRQSDEVLRSLHTTNAELIRRTQNLHRRLGLPKAGSNAEECANQVLDIHGHFTQGFLPPQVSNLLHDDPALCEELARLVEDIHVSLSPGQFKDPADPAYSFHVQHNLEATGELRHEDPIQGAEQQHIYNLNAASALLQELNPLGGLFDQPAARVVGLSVRPRANSVPSASAFRTWRHLIGVATAHPTQGP
ncbi:hypothetical protein C0992_005987 [Termitomyces sp. T32_za158]|nr:hypothetical protein C0992_005987 [Termitomyces sp. T32_za158]